MSHDAKENSPPPEKRVRWSDWWLSVVFLVLYLAVFHLWRLFPAPMTVQGIGGAASVILVILLVLAYRRNYFTSIVDTIGHVVVITDIVAEARLTAVLERQGNHPGYSFYWCALAFAVVIGLYRWYRLYRHQPGDSRADDNVDRP